MALITEIPYTTEEGETEFVYAADEVLNHPEQKVPLVLAMCKTGHDTRRDAQDMGWVKKAQEEGFIVLAPDYNNASTYSETDTIASMVEYIIQNYPVDRTRVSSTAFSNGGALSVALCRDYPQLFAGIAAFAQLVLIEGAEHTPNQYEAEAAWEFLKQYARDEDGRIIAAPSNEGSGEVPDEQRN